MSQREPHRFDLAAALSRSLRPVDLGEFQRRNVGRVRLLRPEDLAGSVRDAIERAVQEHRGELDRLRQAERRATAERDALRTALAEEGARRAAAEAALAEARASRGEHERLRADIERALSDTAVARAEAERLRAERDEARQRLASTLVEREKFRGELVAEPTEVLPVPLPRPAPEAAPSGTGESLSAGTSSPIIGPAERDRAGGDLAKTAPGSAPVAEDVKGHPSDTVHAAPVDPGAEATTTPPSKPPAEPEKAPQRALEVGTRKPAAKEKEKDKESEKGAKPAAKAPKVAFFGFGPALSVPDAAPRSGPAVWRPKRGDAEPGASPPEASD